MTQKGENLLQEIYNGGAPTFSSQVQVDATAKVDRDEMRAAAAAELQ